MFAVRGVALDDAADALADANLWWLVPSFAVFVAGVLLRGLRWWALFEADQRPPLREVTRALLVGYFFNNILPMRAGEAARVISLHARTKTPRAETVGTVVSERVFDLLALLAILFAAYPWLPELSWLRAAAVFAFVVVAAFAVLVFVLVALGRARDPLAALAAAARAPRRLRRARRARGDQRDARPRRDPRSARRARGDGPDGRVVGRAELLVLDPHAGVLAGPAVLGRAARDRDDQHGARPAVVAGGARRVRGGDGHRAEGVRHPAGRGAVVRPRPAPAEPRPVPRRRAPRCSGRGRCAAAGATTRDARTPSSRHVRRRQDRSPTADDDRRRPSADRSGWPRRRCPPSRSSSPTR